MPALDGGFSLLFFSFTARVRRLVFYDSNNDDKDGDAGNDGAGFTRLGVETEDGDEGEFETVACK